MFSKRTPRATCCPPSTRFLKAVNLSVTALREVVTPLKSNESTALTDRSQLQRQPSMNHGAFPRPGNNGKSSTHEFQTLLHADQAQTVPLHNRHWVETET